MPRLIPYAFASLQSSCKQNQSEASMNNKLARVLAKKSFFWLTTNPEILSDFFLETGLDITDLKEITSSEDFLSSLIDFLLTSDKLVLEVSYYLKIKPTDFGQIRLALKGGGTPHWT